MKPEAAELKKGQGEMPWTKERIVGGASVLGNVRDLEWGLLSGQ